MFLLLGCGSGPTLIPVEGVLTSNGDPIEAKVSFVPDPMNPELTEGWATSGSDGRYALRCVHGAGVAEGTYVVRIKPIVSASANLGEVDPAMATFGQAVGHGSGDADTGTERTFMDEVGPQSTVLNFDLKPESAN
ncbi:MAG: hypothetical protein ABI353_09475 [Isosphaeraceae bacterium]